MADEHRTERSGRLPNQAGMTRFQSPRKSGPPHVATDPTQCLGSSYAQRQRTGLVVDDSGVGGR